jgi:histidinol-phosphate aminotransferase
MRNMGTRNIGREVRFPDPVPALVGLHRVREPGSETRAYVGLDRNERLGPLPDWFMESVRQSLETTVLARYPVQDELHRRLSDELQLPEEQILLTAGSDAAIKALYQAYIRPGDAVVMFDPSYAMYSVYAQMFQAEAVFICFDNALKLDTKRLLKSIVPGIRMIMFANPNQPTGTMLDEDVLGKLIERAADVGALVAIDEAYYPFSQRTALRWMKEYVHLLVIRTFSKAAGLAGLRIGYVTGHPDVIANLYKVRSVSDVNGFAILCANQILKHPQIVADYVDEVEAGGRVLAERVRTMGLKPLPTHSNFILIRVGHRCDPAELVDRLRGQGYLIKGPFNAPCLASCVRVTLGPPAIMTAFADVLEGALSEIVGGKAKS